MRVGKREIIFAFNSCAGALLALLIALACDLDKPYWAMMTAYVMSQPFTGALRLKSVFRLIGTALGAVVTVLIIPPLSNAPVLLSLAMSVWVGGCLYFSLLDRTPRSYVFLLAGYTAVFIGFPIVGVPGTAFDVAVSRFEEICIGVLSASFFHTIIFPRSLHRSLSDQFLEVLVDLRAWTADTLAQKKDAVRRKGRMRLAADITNLHMMATHIPFDAHEPAEVRNILANIENKLIQLFPLITGVSDRFKRLDSRKALPHRLEILLDRIIAWLDMPLDDMLKTQGDLQKYCHSLMKIEGTPSWRDLLLFNISTRLSNLIDVYASCRHMIFLFSNRISVRSADVIVDDNAKVRVLHADRSAAYRSAICCTAIVFFGSLFWIYTGWPEGGTAVMMAGVTYCLFASLANPVPAQKTCLFYTCTGSLMAGVYLFVIFPMVHNFIMLAIVLAPALLLSGLFLAQPGIGMRYMSFIIPFCGSLTITRHFSMDFASFINMNIAQFIGISAVVAATGILHRVNAQKSIYTVLHATWSDIADLADGSRRMSSASWMSLMVDRVGILAPYADLIKSSDALRPVNAMRELRTGLNVLRLVRAGAALDADMGQGIVDLRGHLSRYFRYLAEQKNYTDPPEDLLRQIDLQIGNLSALKANRLKDTLLNALTGLRCNLFPDAWAYMYGIDWHD